MTTRGATTADVVVVGAGPAGCVMARRLAEAGAGVLLLEAGSHLASPRAGLLDVGPTSRVVTHHAARRGEEVFDLPRGCTLGGSGAVNGGYCVPAPPADLASWGPEWPERYAVGLARAAERLRPGLAPMGPVAARVAAAFPERVSAVAQARRGGRRVTAFDAWDPRGAGVRVRTGAKVARVRWAGDQVGGRCDGVIVAGNDDDTTISARHVILCAGTIGTTSILRASGLGKSTGHPIGDRVQEHPEVLLEVPADFAESAADPAELPALLSHVIRFELSDARLPDARLSDARPPGVGLPEIEVRPYAVPMHQLIPGAEPMPLRIGVALMNPLGYGRIDPGGMVHLPDDPRDTEVLQVAARLVADRLGVGISSSSSSSSSTTSLSPSTSQHLSGAARIGEVVDHSGCVQGAIGLRVADASILPTLPRRGPYYTVLAVAEVLAAEMVAERPW